MTSLADTAIVAIGRNEGERLIRCLKSALATGALVVYVDSASNDGSAERARQLGAFVVDLDMSIPFSAARARNEGWRTALGLRPTLQFVQFIDGDCELVDSWIPIAKAHLQQDPTAVAVCGRRKERFPEQSIYNLICDIEWNTPCGKALAVGGDALFRLQALQAVDGYRNDVIAGEEPELCVRLRARGGTVWRIDSDMTIHDAAIHTFKAWWLRNKRGGYAFALGHHLHGAPPERHWQTEYRRALLWGCLLPVTAVICLPTLPEVSLALVALMFAQWMRLSLRNRSDRLPRPLSRAALTVAGKLAEAQGALKWHADHLRGASAQIIEYK